MIGISELFGESPFIKLKEHSEKVHECARLLRPLFDALEQGDRKVLLEVADRIFALETEADELRNQLHEQLALKVLLPMRREDLFHILEYQDAIADRTEDVAAVLTVRDMRLPESLMKEIREYVEQVLRNCELASGIMSKLDLLIESAFSGRDALVVSKLITELSQREDQAKARKIELSRKLGATEGLAPDLLILWLHALDYLGEISKSADRTGHGIRMTLQIK